MRRRLTGLGGFGWSANWENVPGDKEVARRALTYLEDRRLLFGERHLEDEFYCVRSANEIRHYMTGELGRVRPGGMLADSLKAIRAACRQFVEAAGSNGQNFTLRKSVGTDPFSFALGELRALVGFQIARIADKYSIEVAPEIATILPQDESSDDPSWLPGFSDAD